MLSVVKSRMKMAFFFLSESKKKIKGLFKIKVINFLENTSQFTRKQREIYEGKREHLYLFMVNMERNS